MTLFFKILMIGVIAIMGLMLIRVFKGPSLFDRLNGMFVIGIDIIVVLLLVGFAEGRQDMYVDIAISYGVLGFISTVIIAKFLASKDREKEDGDDD